MIYIKLSWLNKLSRVGWLDYWRIKLISTQVLVEVEVWVELGNMMIFLWVKLRLIRLSHTAMVFVLSCYFFNLLVFILKAVTQNLLVWFGFGFSLWFFTFQVIWFCSSSWKVTFVCSLFSSVRTVIPIFSKCNKIVHK